MVFLLVDFRAKASGHLEKASLHVSIHLAPEEELGSDYVDM